MFLTPPLSIVYIEKYNKIKTPVAPPPASTTSLNVDIKVQVGEGEPIESALRRFKREVNKSGHLMDLRSKRYFENSQDRKKRKIVQARFRVRMERMNARRMKQQRT
jgi:small subunit ribosomal protein S21